jgi:hypothetical protein
MRSFSFGLGPLAALPLALALGAFSVAACGSDTAAEDDGSSGGPDATRRDGGTSDGAILTPSDGGGVTPEKEGGGAIAGFGKALRFSGNGTGDIDRVKIRIDQPGTTGKLWAMDVGGSDFTLEFWVKGALADNGAKVTCGPSSDWVLGNRLLDRDRFNAPRKYGVSLTEGKIAFGVTGENGSFDYTLCGSIGVLDGAWHHVAVQRRRTDGRMWIFVDGAADGEVDGPDGDVSYPDGVTPPNKCNGPCVDSDPFLVIGAEKYDTDKTTYPPFKGAFDELRVSAVLRYAAAFAKPTAPFATDTNTVGLYHFDEGSGTTAGDTSGATGGPSPGDVRVGGTPSGPTWIDH